MTAPEFDPAALCGQIAVNDGTRHEVIAVEMLPGRIVLHLYRCPDIALCLEET